MPRYLASLDWILAAAVCLMGGVLDSWVHHLLVDRPYVGHMIDVGGGLVQKSGLLLQSHSGFLSCNAQVAYVSPHG